MAPISRSVFARIVAIVLFCIIVAAVYGEESDVVGVHLGAKIQILKGFVYRGHWTLNYVGKFPRIYSERFMHERPFNCLLHDRKTELGRKMFQICDFMEKLQSLHSVVSEEISNLSPMPKSSPAHSREERSFIDVVEWFFSSSTSSQLKKVVETQKRMDERIRFLRYNSEKQFSFQSIFSEKINDWGGNMSDFVSSLSTRVQLMRTLWNGEATVMEQTISDLSLHMSSLLFDLLKVTHVIKQQQIFADCSMGNVPILALNVTEFQSYLRNISNNLQNQGLSLAIKPDDIHAYLNEELATCHISSDDYVITIKIPVAFTSDFLFKIYEIHPLFFVWEGDQCRMWQSPQLVLWNNKTYDIINLSPTKNLCKSNRLCHIPRIVEYDRASVCLAAIMRGNSPALLRSLCSFHCDNDLPKTRVTAITGETFLVSSTSDSLTLLCNSVKEIISPSTTGATVVHVKCNCSLHDGEFVVISRSTPCNHSSESFNRTVIVPMLWTDHDSSFFFDVDRLNSLQLPLNLSLDPGWKQKVPRLILPSPSYPKTTDNFWSTLHFHTPKVSFASFIWNCFLTIVAIFITVKIFSFAKNFRDSSAKCHNTHNVLRHIQQSYLRDNTVDADSVESKL